MEKTCWILVIKYSSHQRLLFNSNTLHEQYNLNLTRFTQSGLVANLVLLKCLTAVEVSERVERVWEKLCKSSFPPQGKSSGLNTCFNTDIAACHSILCFLLCVLGLPGRQRCSSSEYKCARIDPAPWLIRSSRNYSHAQHDPHSWTLRRGAPGNSEQRIFPVSKH